MSDELLPLRTCVQSYDWGSTSVLSGLRGAPDSATPEAELWIGVHPNGPSSVVTPAGPVALADWIGEQPQERLGVEVFRDYGPRLPFLLKILAIAQPLSIQLHPSASQAAAGYAAGSESYADDRHKPELIVALTPLVALRGLRSAEEIIEGFAEHGLSDLLAASLVPLQRQGDRGLWEFVAAMMRLDGAVSRMALEQVAGALDPAISVEAWILRLLESYPGDLGALAPLWMELVELEPGEALYQAPGVLHAYLVGAGVEIMADSDNVLRAGLTPKRRDVDELLRLLVAAPGESHAVRAQNTADGNLWATDADEFTLTRIEVEPGSVRQLDSPSSIEIFLCTRGRAELNQGTARVELAPTEAAVRSASSGTLSLSGDADLWRASVPARSTSV